MNGRVNRSAGCGDESENCGVGSPRLQKVRRVELGRAAEVGDDVEEIRLAQQGVVGGGHGGDRGGGGRLDVGGGD